MTILVFTDLDGTLLNQDDYSFQDALPAIELLKKLGIPLMLVSSKTCDEIFVLRRELGNIYPFVCENGGVVVIPPRVLAGVDMPDIACEIIDDHRCYRCGESRENILKILQAVRPAYRFFGFSDITTDDIAGHTGLDPELARLANKRAASEPIVWQDTDEKLIEFSRYLSSLNLKVVKGGRFHHVMGRYDKGEAVSLLSELYQQHYGEPTYSIALGDSPNDLDMLKNVNLPVVIPGMDGKSLQDPALCNAVFAPCPGAKGWNDAIIHIVQNFLNNNMGNSEG